MSNIYQFDSFLPVIHESAFIRPNATVTGNVKIVKDVSDEMLAWKTEEHR